MSTELTSEERQALRAAIDASPESHTKYAEAEHCFRAGATYDAVCGGRRLIDGVVAVMRGDLSVLSDEERREYERCRASTVSARDPGVLGECQVCATETDEHHPNCEIGHLRAARSGEAEGERVERVRADEVQQGERIWADEAFREVVRTVEDEGVIELWAAERTLLDSLPGDYFVLRLSHPEPRQDQPVDRAWAEIQTVNYGSIEHPKTGEREALVQRVRSAIERASGEEPEWDGRRWRNIAEAVVAALPPEPLQESGEREASVKQILARQIQQGDVLLEAERPLARVVHRDEQKDVLVWRPGDDEDPWDALPENKLVTVLRLARLPHQDVERHEREDFVRGWSEGWQCAGLKADGSLPPQSQIREALTFAGFSDELIDAALAPSPDDRGGER